MSDAPVPDNEADRHRALCSYSLFDREFRAMLARVVEIAADICATEASFISVVDCDRQHFLASRGIEAAPLPRAESLCAHALLEPDRIFEIPDASRDERFLDNPHVTEGFRIRFYASQPIVSRDGHVLAGLCVIDREPRVLTETQRATLRNLADSVMDLFESHRATRAQETTLRETRAMLERSIREHTCELAERETRLNEGEARFRDFAEAASDWFWEMDENLRFTYLSPNVERIIGVPAGDLIGKTREDGLGDDYDRDVWDAHLRTLHDHLPFRDFTYAWKGKRWVRISGKPIFDRDGVFRGYRGIGTDISEIKQSDLALRENEARFRDFAQSSADWFWEMDENLRFEWMTPNVEEIVGVPPEWHYGKTREDLLGDDYDRDVWDAHLRTLRAREPFRDFVFLRTGDGIEQKWIRTSGKPIFDTDGRFLGYRGTASDITGTRVMEEQLRQAQKMESVGQLTGGIAHDFNNLLGVVIGNLDFLAESEGLDDDQKKLIATATQSALRGAELTSRLLSFSRSQALKPEVIDLNVLTDGMMRLLERTLGETIEIRVVPADDLWKAQLDPAQLESALLNLAVNALHAMPAGGRLTVETANVVLDSDYAATRRGVTPGAYVMLAVSDTGCGIPPKELEQVFEPFFTTKEVGKGTGLGLSMVQGFVKQSDGHVAIYSEVGRGTTLRLYFPAVEARPGDTAPDRPEAIPGTGETILVVEDDAELRKLAVTVIGRLGYDVVEAPDGRSALGLLDAGATVDLLFTDVVLPNGMDGHQLMREARRRRPGLPVLYTSGYTDNAAAGNGLLDAGVELVSKPYMRAELGIRLRRALGRDDRDCAPAAGPVREP